MKNKLFLSLLTLVISGALSAQESKKPCNVVASIGKYTASSNVTKAELENLKEVGVKNDCDKAIYTIVSFEFISMKEGKAVSVNGTSAALTPYMIAALKKVSRGSKIFIDNFTVKAPDGKIKKIPGITLHIAK